MHPSRVLGSAFFANFLQVPRTNLTFGSRFFRAAAPAICDSLPGSVRPSDTSSSFRRRLKRVFSKQRSAPPTGKLRFT